MSCADEESVKCQEVEEKDKLLVLYLKFKDDHGTNWGMKICPREKIQLGCSQTSVSDENVVLVMKKVRRDLNDDLQLGCVIKNVLLSFNEMR